MRSTVVLWSPTRGGLPTPSSQRRRHVIWICSTAPTLLVKEFKNATSLLFEESTIKFSKWRKCFLIWRWISGLHHCISRNAKMRCNSKVSIPCFKSCPLYKKKDCSWNTHTWQRKSQKPLSVCCSLLALKFKTFQFTFQSVGVPSAQQKPLPGCLTEWGEKP